MTAKPVTICSSSTNRTAAFPAHRGRVSDHHRLHEERRHAHDAQQCRPR
jgi:hypothetical protein